MTSEFAPDPEWFRWATGRQPTILDVWDGVPSLFLAPTIKGAIFWWQFDVGEDGSDYILLAHLTDAEAQAVFASRTDTGPLEPVRAHIEDDRVIVARRNSATGHESVHLFHVNRSDTFDQFVDWLNHIKEVLATEQAPGEARQKFWRLSRPRVEDRNPTAVAMERLAASAVPV